mmetsp:Transcript_15152/g.57140  ORF Transcript_15152/g.57140 Transcript_15152/m.57140 type:complete len:200 (-) Transcript_15152:34-633(-)
MRPPRSLGRIRPSRHLTPPPHPWRCQSHTTVAGVLLTLPRARRRPHLDLEAQLFPKRSLPPRRCTHSHRQRRGTSFGRKLQARSALQSSQRPLCPAPRSHRHPPSRPLRRRHLCRPRHRTGPSRPAHRDQVLRRFEPRPRPRRGPAPPRPTALPWSPPLQQPQPARLPGHTRTRRAAPPSQRRLRPRPRMQAPAAMLPA